MTEQQALACFKCLADKSRLRLVMCLSREEQYVEKLAQLLDLTPATVSFHLKKLEEAGLVSCRKEQYYAIYSLVDIPMIKAILQEIEPDALIMNQQQARDAAYRQKVVETFFEYGRLKSIPAQRKKRRIVLEEMLKQFDPGKVYSEKEVNEIILQIHADYCTLRREMIMEGLMTRHDGKYQRSDA